MTRLGTLLFAMIGISSLSNTHGADPATLPVEISPADPAIHYSGRFDMREKNAPSCAWPASAVTLKFSGTAISAKFSDGGMNWWQVIVDGNPAPKLELLQGPQVYPIATGLAQGEHTVTLMKATEGFVGATQFLGFQLNGGAKPLPLPAITRRIEIVGDSISCGYGVEAASSKEPFRPRTENAFDAYGAIAAQKLGADYTCIAYSGRKMWPDNTMPEIYDRTLTMDEKPAWDFTAWTPEVVLINLGTNDFGQGTNPEETQWAAAYRKFIARLRRHYPAATIYCSTGTMLSDGDARKSRSTLLAYVKKIVDAENAAGDAKIRALDFGEQNVADGIGADWHPGKKTQQIMAAKLVETLQRDMGWK